VTPERELTIKGGAFPNTTNNLVERNTANNTVDEVERAIVTQVLTKAFSPTVLVIGPQFFNDTFQVNHGLSPEDGIQTC